MRSDDVRVRGCASPSGSNLLGRDAIRGRSATFAALAHGYCRSALQAASRYVAGGSGWDLAKAAATVTAGRDVGSRSIGVSCRLWLG